MGSRWRRVKKRVWHEGMEFFLAARALWFSGGKYTCPCCGWKLRAFTRGGLSFRTRPLGYCPRCNSKARHRRDWLFLLDKTNLFSAQLRLLYVSPNYCFSRRFTAMPNLEYVGIDYRNHLNVSAKVNLAAIPFGEDAFDVIVCIHVLEHVEPDRAAIAELYRVLKPGGWALISVPIRQEQKTYEDPTIVEPEARRRAFGETVHVRFYGSDFCDRLQESGFRAELYPGKQVEPQAREKYGLGDDENIVYCVKPRQSELLLMK